jgi:DNA-binding Xre family transcriptional regulator
MINIRVRELAEGRGLRNAHGLQLEAGLASHVAVRLWKGQVERISIETIDRVCEALDCEPGDFIVRVKLESRKKPKSKGSSKD